MGKMILLLFLLCSEFSHFAFASTRLRQFRLITDEKTGSEVWNACDRPGESLLTLYDEEDANFTFNFLGMDASQTPWIGLREGRSLTWSDGKPFNASESPVNVTNDDQICEAIEDNERRGFSCSDKKSFMCYTDHGNKYSLITISKTWCQALQHCRKHHTNLVSISNETENSKVIDKGKNASFWIGVMHDKWFWQDKGCSSFRKWGVREGFNSNCTAISVDKITKLLCTTPKVSICSKGDRRIRVIKDPRTWEGALEYCKNNHMSLLSIYEEEDQKAVEEWLQHSKLDDSLYWIGLRQSRLFGFWIWSDRTVNTSNWRDGVPPELPMSYPCGAINSTAYTWSDADCSTMLPFICEEEIIFMD